MGAWNKIGETLYVYDGWNVIAELDQSGTTVKSHLWGLDLSGTLQGAGGVGGLLATIEGTERYSHTYDGNGNVTATIKDDGTVAAYYEFDPFGNTSYMTGPQASANPYRFSTKYLDPETNLYYYGYRYYSPELGRWINRDPIEEQGGLNLYGFVGNDGVNKWDTLGLTVDMYITRLRYTNDAISGRIKVISDCTNETFYGATLEDRVPTNVYLPVPAGTYGAFIRKVHTPNRIELRDVPKATNIQIHIGNTVKDVDGCFLVGNRVLNDFIYNSGVTINEILDIIANDGSKIIYVHVIDGAVGM